jgi:hypothetical protein
MTGSIFSSKDSSRALDRPIALLRDFGGLPFARVAFIEAIDAPRSIDQFLFARKERMTVRADFDMKIAFARRPRLKTDATCASDRYLMIIRMNALLHYFLAFRKFAH